MNVTNQVWNLTQSGFLYLMAIPFPLHFSAIFNFLDSHVQSYAGFYIICPNYIAEVKVVVVFDAANSGLSTHKETYKG
jgi:hypothetical protein